MQFLNCCNFYARSTSYTKTKPVIRPSWLGCALLFFIASFFFFSPSSYAQIDFDPPVAKKVADTLTIHDTVIVDPYSWMKQKQQAAFVNHLYAENAYTDNVMSESALLRKKLYEEMKARIKQSDETRPRKQENYWYYSRTIADKQYPILLRKKDSLTAPEEVYLDLNALAAKSRFFQLSGLRISPDQNRLAYAVDYTGDRISKIYFKDLETGAMIKDSIPEASSFVWANDNRTIYYTMADRKTKRTFRLFRHVVGDPTKRDQLIFEEYDPTFSIGISRTSSKKYLIVSTSNSSSAEAWYMPADGAEHELKLFRAREKKHSYSINEAKDGIVYVTSDKDAPNGQMFTTTFEKNGKEPWEVFIPHNPKVQQGGVVTLRDFYVISENENAIPRIRIIDRKTKDEWPITFPDSVYSVGVSYVEDYDSTFIEYTFNSMVKPVSTFRYDLPTRKSTLIKTDTVPNYDPEQYETRRIYATAKDGTQVPISMVYKKGIKLDGSNPAMLYSYGSYGSSQSVGFNRNILSYLNRGFVYAIAHIRGGSDLGRHWYDDGRMLNKMNTFTDFIACAERLIELGYTNNKELAIRGASAGGLLMGAVTNLRPDLFQSVVAEVPFVDVINTMLDSTLPLTTFEYEEWGNPHIKKYFDYMINYSPYDNVRAKAYPNMLVKGGFNDSQVGIWEPAKWVARLREVKTDDNLLLFKIGMDGGHGMVSGRYNQWKEEAEVMAFVMKTLGIEENYLVIKGQVVDENGSPLPYANIVVKGSQDGTTSNHDGRFVLELQQGKVQELEVKYVGFKTAYKKINIDSKTEDLTIRMKSEDILIKEYEVKSNAKDPAYGIIKKAIENRKKHLNDVQNLETLVYMKTVARLDEVPEKRPFFIKEEDMPDSTDLGLVYLSESTSQYWTEKPDNYKENMLASRTAGYSQGYSSNRANDVMFDFYKNNIRIEYYSERPFLSPIAGSALLNYRYKLEGVIYEDGLEINKIKVIPRRKGDPLFHGYIYIIEDLWSIHSVDLLLTKDAQIKFVDTVSFQQTYVPLEDSIWVPKSNKFSSHFNIFGFGATQLSVSVFSNARVNQQFEPKFFRAQVFSVTEGANKKDSVFWKIDARSD